MQSISSNVRIQTDLPPILLPKSLKQAQRFLPVHGQIRNLFGAHRYKMAANDQRAHLIASGSQWQEIVMQEKCA